MESAFAAAKEGGEVVIPLVIAAVLRHLAAVGVDGPLDTGILGLFVQGDVQHHLRAAAEYGNGSGVAGLELPQSTGQVTDAVYLLIAHLW